MVACPTLETERLVLRPFRDDDLADYFAMEDSPEVRAGLGTSDESGSPTHFSRWLPGSVSGSCGALDTGRSRRRIQGCSSEASG